MARRPPPRRRRRRSAARPSFAAIVRRRAAWGAALGHLCGNYGFYFVVFWLPLYLVKGRGFSLVDMAQIGGLIYLVYAASSFIAGWASDRWMATGASANLVRKSFVVGGSIGAAACLALCAAAGPVLAVASLIVAAVFFGFQMPMIFSIGQTLSGPRAAGKWMGFQNGVGNIAGIVGPLITGALVDRSGGYAWALAAAAGVSLLGALAWGVVIPRIAPIDWAEAGRLEKARRIGRPTEVSPSRPNRPSLGSMSDPGRPEPSIAGPRRPSAGGARMGRWRRSRVNSPMRRPLEFPSTAAPMWW